MSQRDVFTQFVWRAVMDGNGIVAGLRLNVSRSVVQRLWDQYPKILCPEDLFPRATTPAEDSARRRRTTTVLTISSIRKKNLCYYGAKSSSQWLQEDQLCAFSTDDSKGTAYAGQENMFLDAATMGFCAVHRRVSDSGRLLIWREQRTRYHQSNTVEKDTVIEVVESWFGQDLARWPH
ncbi:hypothetical protein TNCV_3762411 [Trichonephila clavipes]|nr:hypothetical protein TNCV_3762411 [Trichonephila clavipes]